MAYTVLARRYRSQTFDDVVGQEPVAQTLKNAIRAGRVAHAYLFTGTRGVGKTTMARILAKALNCLRSEGPTAEPCLECDSCRAIHAGDDIDVIEIDGASNTGVDNIRQLRENALYRPARARFKIYIIDEVHMLSTGAFNALLKILEEPPDHVKFIFATTEPHKVLPTIQSRCQRFDFRSLQPAEIAGQLERILKAEQIAYEPDAVVHLARLANGSMRDALSLLDQLTSAAEPLGMDLVQSVLGQGGREELCVLLEHIAGRDGAAVLAAIDTLLKAGRTPAQLVEGLIDTLRDLMVLRCTDAGSDLLVLTDQERQRLSGLAEAFDTPALIYGITALERLRWTIRNSETARALLEASLLRLTLSEHFIGVDQLLSRLGGAPAAPTGVKKNAIAAPAGRSSRKPTPTGEATTAISGTAGGTDQRVAVGRIEAHVDSIREQWPAILAAFKQENPANGSLLTTAEPLAFEGGVLTLGYDPTAIFARNLCEARADAVAEQLSRIVGFALRLRVEGTASASAPAAAPPRSAVTQQALDDPAVKTLLAGLDASVIQIEPVGPTP